MIILGDRLYIQLAKNMRRRSHIKCIVTMFTPKK